MKRIALGALPWERVANESGFPRAHIYSVTERLQLLERGQALPPISGRTMDHKAIRVSDYRGRKNIVLVFSHNRSDERFDDLISALASRYGEIQMENAEALGVIAGNAAEYGSRQRYASVPFPLLLDEDNSAHRSVGAVDSNGHAAAGVCITDRYGQVYFAERCSDAGCASANDILEWLRFIEIQCPECGVSEWPQTGS